MQLSLMDSLPLSADPSFRCCRRVQLGPSAWLDVVPEWLTGHHRFFEQLRCSADWEHHRRQMYERIVDVPRLVAAMPGEVSGLAYDGEITVARHAHTASHADVSAVANDLRRLGGMLSQRYCRPLASVSLAYYRDGNDSVAFHGDKLGDLRRDTVVAILSVGARRRFLLRPAGQRDRESTLTFNVGEGDLLVMGGDCQERWEHAVPKARSAGPRIAIMFRERRSMTVRVVTEEPGPRTRATA